MEKAPSTRRSFLRALGGLSILACHRRSDGAAGERATSEAAVPETSAAIDRVIDQRIAEENVDYVTLLEADPSILRRAPEGMAASLRRTLREHPEAATEMNAFRVAALERLKRADLRPEAKRLMLEAQLEKVPHAVTTCMEHFIGVHDLLKAWGHADEVALVGLFHAIYGTEFFVLDLLDYRRPGDRLRVQSVVGERTERWIVQYALMLSSDFVAGAQARGAPPAQLDFFESENVVPASISASDFLALAELQVANAYEPFTHSGKELDLGNVTPYAPLRPFLSPGAKSAIDATLRGLPAEGAPDSPPPRGSPY